MTPLTEAIKELYPDVERRVLPVIKNRAKRLRGISDMDVDDAIQEARVALLKAMARFDFNASDGDFAPYMSVVVVNTCRALYAKSRQARRMPRAPSYGRDGWELVPTGLLSIDGNPSEGNDRHRLLAPMDAEPLVDSSMEFRESAMRVSSFRRAMEEQLGEREQQVLRCRIDPPSALVDQIEGEGGDASRPSNIDIGKYLGLNKNQMDWAFYKIRNVFTEVASQVRFSDVFADLVKGTGWPVIHVSQGDEYNNGFVQQTIQSRCLHGPHRSDTMESCELGSRRVVEYPWGAVIVVEKHGICWTVVAEGNFNPRSGEVTGALGARKLLPIEGYMQLARALANKRRETMGETEKTEEKWGRYKVLPHCISDYEPGNGVCDGVEGDEGEPPCVHRDTCVALQARMKDKKTKVGSYVVQKEDKEGNPYCEPKSLAKFGKLVTACIRAYGVKDGTVTHEAKPLKATSKKAAKKAEGAKEGAKSAVPEVKPRAEASIVMDAWFERWLEVIIEGTGREFHDGDSPEVGQLFIKDRRAKSGYVGLYCKPLKGRPVAVALIYYKPRNLTMDLKLPLGPGEYDGIGMDMLKMLHPEEHSDGLFISLCKGLSETGVIAGAEVIVKLVTNGVIQLPDAP